MKKAQDALQGISTRPEITFISICNKIRRAGIGSDVSYKGCVKLKEKYRFRKAVLQEIPAVFALIMDRVAWMDRVGIRQWNITKYDERYPLAYYEKRQQMDELFVLEDCDTHRIVCVGALLHRDPRWPDVVPAYYLHHFAAATDAKGVGSIFLQYAEQYTANCKMQYLRLDSAVGNKKLETYYTDRGYIEAGYCIDGLYQGVLRQKKLPE